MEAKAGEKYVEIARGLQGRGVFGEEANRARAASMVEFELAQQSRMRNVRGLHLVCAV